MQQCLVFNFIEEKNKREKEIDVLLLVVERSESEQGVRKEGICQFHIGAGLNGTRWRPLIHTLFFLLFHLDISV